MENILVKPFVYRLHLSSAQEALRSHTLQNIRKIEYEYKIKHRLTIATRYLIPLYAIVIIDR